MRTKWQNGTVLYTQEGARYKITASNEAGGTAIIYYAEKAGSGIRRVLKEFYPEGWERRKGVPVRSEYLDCPDDDNGLLSCYASLVELAKREMDISQKVARETAHVWPVRGMLKVEKVCEPDGTVWQMEGGLPCCILEMDNLNHRDGRWIQDILREATERKGEDTPLGNLQEPESEPVLAVPPLEVTLMVVWHLLVLLAKIHAAGYLHGDINLGNVFMVLDDKGEKIENAMLIDFGSARELKDGVTAPLGEDAVMATPGFCAPELRDGGGEQRLTPKADVYSVGKLMHCLLDQNILEALRNGWYSNVTDELENPTLDPSGINDARVNPAVRKSLDRILAGAAEEEPEKRSSVREMLDEVVQLYWKIAPPAWQMSLSLPKLNEDEVLGREKDVKTVENALWEDNTLVLHGFSGIGKTKFVTLLGHEWERDYPGSRAYYAFFPGSMTGLVVDTLAQHISTVELEETRNGKNVPRAADAIIGDVFRELNAHMHEQDLLIIDNVDSDTVGWEELVHDEDAPGRTDLFQRFDELQCRVVFVTRMNLQDAKGIVPLEVPELEEKPLRAILRKYSDDAEKRSDDELDTLINLVERHTMTVDIIARTMKRSRLTVPEIYEELSRGDYDSDAFVEVAGEKENDRKARKIEGHLVRLFRLAGFNEREQEVLRYAQLIGETSGMYEKLFLYCCPHKAKGENAQNIKALDHLIQLGYVQQKKENGTEEVILNLHTLVRVVAKKEMAITPEQCDEFLKQGQAMVDDGEPNYQFALEDAYSEAWMLYGHKVPIAYLWASYLMNLQMMWWEKTDDDDKEDCDCFIDVIEFSMQEGIESYPWVANFYLNIFRWFYWQIEMFPEELHHFKESEKFCRLMFGKADKREANLTFSEEMRLLQKYAETGEKFLKSFHPKTPREQDWVLWVYDALYHLYKERANVPDAAVRCAEQVITITKQRYPGQTGVELENLFDGYKGDYILIANYYYDLGKREELAQELRQHILPKKNLPTENIHDTSKKRDDIERLLSHARVSTRDIDGLVPQDVYFWDSMDVAIRMACQNIKDDRELINALQAEIENLEASAIEETDADEKVLNWSTANILMARLYIRNDNKERAREILESAKGKLKTEIESGKQRDTICVTCYISICIRSSLLYAQQGHCKEAADGMEEAILLAENIAEYRQLTVPLMLEQKAVFYEKCGCEADAQAERHRILETFRADTKLKSRNQRTVRKYFELAKKILCLLEQEKRYPEKLRMLKELIEAELRRVGGGLIKEAGSQENLEEFYQQAIEAAQKSGEFEEARSISESGYQHFSENAAIWPIEFIRISCTRAYVVCEWNSDEAEDILKKAFECLKQIFQKGQFQNLTATQREKLFGEEAVSFFRMRLEALRKDFPEEIAVIRQQKQILEEIEKNARLILKNNIFCMIDDRRI